MKTASGLVAHVKQAYRENWGYVLGTYGQRLTRSVYNAKMAQGGRVGAYNKKHSSYVQRFMGTRVSDCYGLVKGYVMRKKSNGDPIYEGKYDRNQEGAYKAARIKGPLSTLPETPGAILWKKGHAGVYIGNNEWIECIGAPTGMYKGKMNSRKQVIKGTRWTHWFLDTNISYDGVPTSVSPGAFTQGNTGSGVRKLQSDLKALGYPIEVDGSFGPDMETIVRQFQSDNNLTVDGSVGPATQKKVTDLGKVSTPSRDNVTISGSALVEGMRGSEVKEIQGNLKKLGYTIDVDASFGPATKRTVIRFQDDNGLEQDGSFGPASQKKMKELLNATNQIPIEKILKYGSRGEDVNKLQSDLRKLGYDVRVMGGYGDETREAVRVFQSRHDGVPRTGEVDEITTKMIEVDLKAVEFYIENTK